MKVNEFKSKLNELDKASFDNNTKYYGLLELFEAIKPKISKDDFIKLTECENDSKKLYNALNEKYNKIYGIRQLQTLNEGLSIGEICKGYDAIPKDELEMNGLTNEDLENVTMFEDFFDDSLDEYDESSAND